MLRQQQQAKLTGLSQAMVIAAAGLTVTLMLWLAAGGISQFPQPGALIALFVFTPLAAFEALGPVAAAFQHLGQVIASAQRVSQIIDQPADVTFPTQGPVAAEHVSLSLQNLNFTYPGQPLPVLKNVTLDVRAGEHIALLGQTGCGKSTLLQLLTRGWDITSGTLEINGHAIGDYDEATLRKMITVVSQRAHVFNTTLRENLRMASPQCTDEQIAEALRQVDLDVLLKNEGLNAWLGEGGRQLSGGEQRRIGLARALLHDAPLWLLDEPTEGLDAETEQHILALLHKHCQNKTLLLVTHRLHGLETFDRICVMEEGQIVEQGDHASLIAAQGRYARFLSRT